MVDAIGTKNITAVPKVDRPPKESKKNPRQQPAPEQPEPESEEEKRRVGANIDERC